MKPLILLLTATLLGATSCDDEPKKYGEEQRASPPPTEATDEDSDDTEPKPATGESGEAEDGDAPGVPAVCKDYLATFETCMQSDDVPAETKSLYEANRKQFDAALKSARGNAQATAMLKTVCQTSLTALASCK